MAKKKKGISTQKTLRTVEPMKVARMLTEGDYAGPNGRPTLICIDGTIWSYHPRAGWTPRTDSEMSKDLMRRLEDLQILVKEDPETGEKTFASYAKAPGTWRGKVSDVLASLKALLESRATRLPFWRDPSAKDPDPMRSIAFQNTVIEIRKNGIRGIERNDRLVTPATLPFEYDPEAECPRWMRCLEEWSTGEPGWAELLQRWWGYVLLPDRSFSRWMYMFGKVRGGKGLNLKLIERLLGGYPNYVPMSLEELSEPFGLDGLQNARVLGVGEVNKMRREDGEIAARNLKRFLGGDSVRVNTKYGGISHGERVAPAPWVCGNEILRVSNSGEGISSKMLPLHFQTSFLDREDLGLEEKLWKEMPGILAWAVEGALKVVSAEPRDRWPLPESSVKILNKFRLHNNPLEQFMETMLVKSDSGSVQRNRILKLWDEFRETNRLSSTIIPPNQLLSRMEQDTSWNVRGEDGVLKGVRVRKRESRYEDI